METHESRRTTVTLGPFYLTRQRPDGDPLTVGVTTGVQFSGIVVDLPKAAKILRSRLTSMAESAGFDRETLPELAEHVFDGFTARDWTDGNGLVIPDHVRLMQLNLVCTDPAHDAPSPITVVTITR